MKFRFLTLVLAMAVLFPFAVSAADAPLTPSLELIRKGLKLNKCGIAGTSIEFCEEDFLEVTGKNFDYLTVTTLPPLESGVLKLAGVDVLKGQSISKEALNYLKFVPTSACTEELCFNFSVSSAELKSTEIECSLYYFGSLNFAPVVKSAVLETYEGIAVSGNLETYDPEGDGFTFVIESYPRNGIVKVSSDGSFVYSPTKGIVGKDSFVYHATDKYGNRSVSSSATINVRENESGIYFADMKDKASHMAAVKLSETEVTTYTLIGDSFYFSPEESVTRADFTVMMLSAMDEETKALAQNSVLPDTAVFDDISHLSEGRQKFITLATELGFLESGGQFRPLDPITKSEASEMIDKALKERERSIGTAYYVNKFSDDTDVLTKEGAALILCSAFN